MKNLIERAAEKIARSPYTVAFTGAGISVESGIPPFRGANGLWAKYDPVFIDRTFFADNPAASWEKIHEVFYACIGSARPNAAHEALALLEKQGLLQVLITQNIDCLHQRAGSREVYEFHGTTSRLSCLSCGNSVAADSVDLTHLPPRCDSCGGILKPDFVFFGEQIDPVVIDKSIAASKRASVMLVVGTTGEIMPASELPYIAKRNGACIIEINPDNSAFTETITDIHLEMNATGALHAVSAAVTEKGTSNNHNRHVSN